VPLLVANKRAEDRISPLFFAAMSQRTLRDVLGHTIKHWRYATEAVEATLVDRGPTVQLRLAPLRPPPLGLRLGLEYLLLDLVTSARDLGAADWRPLEVVLAWSPRPSRGAWEDRLGVRVRVDPGSPGLVMARDSLDMCVRPVLPHAAGALFDQVLEWLTPPVQPTASVADQVAAVVAADLRRAPPGLDHVARTLGMSTRSLHRRLAAEGTSFLRLLDRIRRDAAIRCMLDGDRQLKSVAAAIGFSDMRGFRRAFKRWTGLSPQQFRLERPSPDVALAALGA
jgi:AraC-like DNA-binding protein